MPDRHHRAITDLAPDAHRFCEPLAGFRVKALVQRDHAQVVLRHADRPAIADLAADRQRTLVGRTCGVVVTAVLGHDREVRVQAREGSAVAESRADFETRLIGAAGRGIVALLGCYGSGQVQREPEARVVAQRAERVRGEREPVFRLCV